MTNPQHIGRKNKAQNAQAGKHASNAKKAVSVKSLVKEFGKSRFRAVDDVSFDISKGEIFGLVGPNGAGKTTLMSMLTTVLQPTKGSVEIFGNDICRNSYEARKHIGVVFQEHTLDDELTVYENLDFHARIYKLSDKHNLIAKALAFSGLEKVSGRQAKELSGGMKRRLEIARALLHNPEVLFLDEPTLGLDAQARRDLWEYITELNKERGLTVFLTTHYLEEADKLCGRIAIMNKGRIAELDSPSALKKRYKLKSLEDVFIKVSGHEISEEDVGEDIAAYAHSRVG